MHRSFAIRSVLIVTALAVMAIALASSTPSKAASPSANLAAVFSCTPTGIGVFETRVHVRCSAGIGGGSVVFFAVCSTGTNSALASRMLSAFTTARALSRPIDLYYNAGDTSGAACGCGTGDCMRIWGAEVR